MSMTKTVEVEADSLEVLADYVADDLRDHMDDEMLELESAVKDAYSALGK